jgi:putative FmdB family regulatory protein
MPTYDYMCTGCGHNFDHFQSITSPPLKKCPSCEKNSLKRLIGSGSGIIFKGSGFYQTDYRSESYRQAQDKDKKSTQKDGKNEKGKKGEKTPSGEKKAAPAPEKST